MTPASARGEAAEDAAAAAEDAAEAARHAAEAAARAAGVTVAALDTAADHARAERLESEVWGGDPPVSRSMMSSLAHAGGYVAGAFDGPDLVGLAAGFLARHGDEEGVHLHSHVAAVAPVAAGRQVGFAVKLHQRAWAMQRGLCEVSWTYDPLIRRNAYFNLAKLGADATAYLPDFYGELDDGINAGHGSDRLLVRWDLGSDAAVAAAEGTVRPAGDVGGDPVVPGAGGATVVLDAGGAGEPVAYPAAKGGTMLLGVPEDIEALRRRDRGMAGSWRAALREAMAPALAAGWRVAGFTRSGWYVLVDEGGVAG